MKFLSDLWKKIPTKTKIYGILIILLILIFSYMAWKIRTLESKLTIAQNNVSAVMDTIRVTKTKNGELESAKLALLADNKTLKDLSDSLFIEVKKEKGKIKYIVSAGITIHDTVKIIPSHVVGDTIKWAYDRDDSGGSRHLAGASTKDLTWITKDELSLNLITGLRERSDKKMEIFIRTRYPGVSFTSIEGAILDPTQPMVKPPDKKFSVGPCISIILDPTGNIRYGIGIGLQWSLLKF